jgi:hypothetical protein
MLLQNLSKPQISMQSVLSKKNVILATYLAGIYDVNRNEVLPADDISVIEAWVESIVGLGLYAKYSSNIDFVKVQFNGKYNTNIFRYFLYNDYIKENNAAIENIFITDITDVVVVNNPFVQPLFMNNVNSIFCGDEPKLLDNDWMHNHSTHLRNKINDYAIYEEEFKTATLLNCGIVGGSIAVMQPFLEKLCDIHDKYNTDNTTAYTGDMGAFNYLARTKYNTHIIHGAPVNSIFKMYETERLDCWFRHK